MIYLLTDRQSSEADVLLLGQGAVSGRRRGTTNNSEASEAAVAIFWETPRPAPSRYI